MLRFRTLGTIDLRGVDGEELRSVLAQPKRVALLAYLALEARRGWQRRDRLMSLFWPELDDEHARNALNQALFFLRRHLGGDVIRTRNSEDVALAPDGLWCDAVAFEDAVSSQRHADAVELYRGELLASFHVSDAAPELEQWIEGERHLLAGRYAEALQVLAEEREQARDLKSATIWWRRLAAQRPHDGKVALKLMRALAVAGERAAALEHAKIYTTLVRQELEIDPDPEIEAFASSLRRSTNTHPLSPSREPEAVDSTASPNSAPAEAESDQRRRAPQRLWKRFLNTTAIAIAVAVLALVALWRFDRADIPEPAIRHIAVLPFENLTNDPAKEYLADVMTDALITELARYPELNITSRMSVLQYKGTKRSAAEIAKALRVGAFVEGTLSGDGRMIQVTAQLINAPNDRHLWADRYVRDSTNVLAIESDIASSIAREVNIRATPVPGRTPLHRAPNAVASSIYLRGQEAMLRRTPTAMQEARTYFHQSIAQDSSFARGYAGLSEAVLIAGIDGFMPLNVARDSAAHMASRAITLDSLLAEGHTALAGVYADEARWGDAEREFRVALRISPSEVLAHHWYAQLLAIQERYHEAHEHVFAGQQLDPTSASLARTAGPIEVALHMSRPSSERAEQAVLRDPFHGWSRASFANRLSQEGRCPEARAHIDTAKAMIPDNIRMLVSVFAVEWRCGDRAKATQMLAQMKRRSDARARGLWIANIYRTLNQNDSAFVWLDSVEWNGDLRFNFRVSPAWNATKKDSRYARVLRRMGLP